MQCTVKGCRYSTTHITAGHQCGKCHQYGHGRMDCNSSQIQITKKCIVDGCRYSTCHDTQNHQCGNCHQYGHGRRECGNNDKIIALQHSTGQLNQTSEAYAISEAQKLFGNLDGKIIGKVYAGMGCDWYVKRDSCRSPILVFFMHADNWGQYGPQSDDRQKLKYFCAGYNMIN